MQRIAMLPIGSHRGRLEQLFRAGLYVGNHGLESVSRTVFLLIAHDTLDSERKPEIPTWKNHSETVSLEAEHHGSAVRDVRKAQTALTKCRCQISGASRRPAKEL